MNNQNINRRNFMKYIGLGLSAAAFGGCNTDGLAKSVIRDKSTAKKPNIIFIMADDLGYGDLGCYGQRWIKTPNIDRIRREGMKFTDFYAGSPVCAPSRCTLMTGMHTGHAYIRGNGNPPGRKKLRGNPEWPGQNPIPANTVTIAKLLKKQGYATAAIGKWGLGYHGSQGDATNQGFDLFFGYNCQIQAHNYYPRWLWKNDKKIMLKGNDRGLTGKQYSQDLFIGEALSFIRQNKTKPFFLYLPFTVPHLSLQVPEDSLDQYKGKIPETPYKHRSGYLKNPYPHAAYAAMITRMDKGIGQIMALVKQLGLDDDTIIFFTSDNGPTFERLGGADSTFFDSAGPFRGRKGSVYEGGLRVPMVVRWPGHIKPDSTTHLISALWDVMPTLCDLAHCNCPDNIDGISFAPTLLGRAQQKKHKFLYWEFIAYGGSQAVRMGKWKGVRTGLRKKNTDTSIQLYNLETDKGEQHNVSAQHPDMVRQIKQIMLTQHTKSKLFPFPQIKTRPF